LQTYVDSRSQDDGLRGKKLSPATIKKELFETVLATVSQTARQLCLYPMFVFTAHTGARRSEILRSQVDGIDLMGQTLTFHEKKRVRGRFTTRTVPISPVLHEVLYQWLSTHSGVGPLFSLGLDIQRTKKNELSPSHSLLMKRKTILSVLSPERSGRLSVAGTFFVTRSARTVLLRALTSESSMLGLAIKRKTWSSGIDISFRTSNKRRLQKCLPVQTNLFNPNVARRKSAEALARCFTFLMYPEI